MNIDDLKNDPSVYLLPPGGSGQWPCEANDPAKYGIKTIVVQPGDYTGYNDTNANSEGDNHIFQPRSGGKAGEPVRLVYWNGVDPFDIENIPHPFDQSGFAHFHRIRLQNEGDFHAADHFHVIGIKIDSQGIVRSATNSGFLRCYNDQAIHDPFTIRFGCTEAFVEECLIRRDSWAKNDDVVGVQVEKASAAKPNLNCRLHSNVIINYTDGWQATASGESGENPGLSVKFNYCLSLLPPNPDGSAVEGLEQVGGGDFKTGGTPENPVVVEGNFFANNRPNCRTPGYAHNLHKYARHIRYRNNIHANSNAGIFLVAQYVVFKEPQSGWVDPDITFEGDIFTGIQTTGGNTIKPEFAGCVIAGPNGVSMTDVTLIACEKFANQVVDTQAARSFTNVKVVEDGITFDPGAQSVSDYSIEIEQVVDQIIQIPYTNDSVTIRNLASNINNTDDG